MLKLIKMLCSFGRTLLDAKHNMELLEMLHMYIDIKIYKMFCSVTDFCTIATKLETFLGTRYILF